MNPPAVVIRLALEERPVVYLDALNDGEADRLTDWIRSRAEYHELVGLALELAQEAHAA